MAKIDLTRVSPKFTIIRVLRLVISDQDQRQIILR